MQLPRTTTFLEREVEVTGFYIHLGRGAVQNNVGTWSSPNYNLSNQSHFAYQAPSYPSTHIEYPPERGGGVAM